jgi:hypothetical protein
MPNTADVDPNRATYGFILASLGNEIKVEIAVEGSECAGILMNFKLRLTPF